MVHALSRMITIAATVGVVMSLTYQVPELERFRPWVDGDRTPFAQWTGDEAVGPGTVVPEFGGSRYAAAGATEAGAADEAGVTEELMAEAVEAEAEGEDDDELLAPPPTTPEPAPPEPPPSTQTPSTQTPTPPSPTAPVGEPPADPRGRTGGGAQPGEPISPSPSPAVEPPAPARPRVVIEAREYDGLPREIEDPSGVALDHFFGALEQTALRQDARITRISHWGASVIGADGMTHVARRKLQARFGSGGKGWVNIAPGWQWYRQKDVVFEHKGWRGRTVTSHKLQNDRYGPGFYGFGGVAAKGYGGAHSTYQVYSDRLELYYLAFPTGGEVAVSVDGGEPVLVSTMAEAATDAWHVFEAPDRGGEHTFTVKAKGPVHLYGVTLERDGPGVVYDCVGMIGTRASRILNYDEQHLRRQVEHRNPDLQIIMFGGNELVDHRMNLRLYEEKYRDVIGRLRAGAPNASCMMMTPVDHGERYRGRIRTVPLLKRMVDVQQRIAADVGCAFFNTVEAMGGEGAIGRWYYARPRLAWGDFAHLTKAGDRVMGAVIYKALMKAFADWLAARP